MFNASLLAISLSFAIGACARPSPSAGAGPGTAPPPTAQAQAQAQVIAQAQPAAAPGGTRPMVTVTSSAVSIPMSAPAMAPGQELYLVLRDYHFSTDTSLLYHFYLGSVDDAHYLGPISSFNAVTLVQRDSFDVTRIAADLKAAGQPLTVHIVPMGAGDPATLDIGKLELVAQ
jgi:hypothetical protein